jgi:hypothetical protein
MTALTQDAWHEDRYPASSETPARHIGQTAHRRGETQDAAIRFIQSQIGGPLAALAAETLQALDQVEF